jgi:hypothetical protein
MKSPYLEFVNKLKKLYGSFDEAHKKFEKAPNSEISRDLGYSDAQFSRLINDTATEGEYNRANQNADRILALIRLESQVKSLSQKQDSKKRLLIIVFIFVGLISAYLLGKMLSQNETSSEVSRYDMLRWTFESNFINPYKGLRDLPADCDYRCYKYQGRWELKQEYKLPFLRESSGFHYLAKSVVAYIRCVPNDNPQGKLMIGYEYQEHEIWYDILERPIGAFISEDGTPLDTYEQLKFEQQEDFVKIGTVHSFYTNDFSLDSTFIYRKGQDIGRDIEFVSDEELEDKINNKPLLAKIKREMTLIVQDPLHDFSKPSACNPALMASNDFHSIASGTEMTFECQMTTAGRFPINYTKTYILKDQFIKDRCRTDE